MNNQTKRNNRVWQVSLACSLCLLLWLGYSGGISPAGACWRLSTTTRLSVMFGAASMGDPLLMRRTAPLRAAPGKSLAMHLTILTLGPVAFVVCKDGP